ncbi:MAG: phosphate ABC transporter substrate-binding protein PstS family protein [Cyanobacteria bacterium J06635_15]
MFSRRTFVGTTLAVAATAGLAVPAISQSGTEIKIDGSSTVFPITEAMAEAYGGNVTVGVSGTGGGFRKFCAGETDISNASREIKEEEIAECAASGIEYVKFDVAFDAITVVVPNDSPLVQDDGSVLPLTVEQLNVLWRPDSPANTWSELDSSWPNEEISLYGPGTDSGTFDYFTDEINGEEGASRNDYVASEDDNVLVLGVSGETNALGYFGLAYYAENASVLKAVPIDAGEGPVLPTAENVNNGTYTPLSRPIFIYVNAASLESNSDVRSFVEFYLTEARDSSIIPEVGYVQLPDTQYTAYLNSL